MSYSELYQLLGIVVVGCPFLLLLVLGATSLSNRQLSEQWISRLTQVLVSIGLLASVTVLGMMLVHGERLVEVSLGNWVSLPEHHQGTHPDTHPAIDADEAHHGTLPLAVGGDESVMAAGETLSEPKHFHFEIKFAFDRLSVPYVILSFLLCGIIGAFAKVYMHKEEGYRRFFVLYAVFLLGMVVSGLAGTIETLFAGWELVGLSSTFLVAFYHERTGPVTNALRVWTVYRIADAAFLIAAISLHHLTGEGDFVGLMGSGAWPTGVASISSNQALFVGGMLLVAAAGKSALIPFSGWLPRAMEGPTPSSAIFYGALSVHLGAYLLLRVSPILALSSILSGSVIALGLSSAVYGAIVGRVQTDIKSALSFASMTQVGIIVAEIGCGWNYLALTHLLGHACLRTLQLLRAPSLLMDYHHIENAMGLRRAAIEGPPVSRNRTRLYRFAFERGHLDNLLDNFIVLPFFRLFRACDRWEQLWTDWLSGTASRESTDDVSELENGESR